MKKDILDYIGYAFLTVIIIAVLLACYVGWVEFQQDRADYKVQGECIASYIKDGVERRDIILIGKTDCEVKR